MARPIGTSIIFAAMEKMTYGQRVKLAREAEKMSQGALARKIGISQPSLFQLENNPTATSSKHNLKIARAVGVLPEWLETGEGPMHAPGSGGPYPVGQVHEIDISTMSKDLPVMGNAACGDDGLFELNGEVMDYVRRPPRLARVKDAYALWTAGDSMSPWRENGGLVVVHPHQPVRINDYVVVQLEPRAGDNRRPAYIKKLVKRTAGNLTLLQYNPRKEMPVPVSKIAAVHRILDWDEALGI